MKRVAHAVTASLVLAGVVTLGAPGQVAAEGGRGQRAAEEGSDLVDLSASRRPGEILAMGSTPRDVAGRPLPSDGPSTVSELPGLPELVSARYAGDIGAANSTVGGGGTFEVTGGGGRYQVVVSRDGRDFSPTAPVNRVIRADRDAGTATIAWDGRDNRNEPFPAGTGYAYRVTLHRHDPVTGTLSVIADPGPPPTATADALATPGGTSVAVPAPGLLGNDTGTGLAVTVAGVPAHGTVAVDPDGAYVYTPTPSYSGVDAFAYTTTDSLGRTATAQAAVRVRPAARADVRATSFETPITVAVLANDTGSALRLAAVDQPPPGEGRVTIGGGRLRYAPPRGFTGVAAFGYTAVDAAGQRSTAGVRVSVAFPVVPAAEPDTELTPAGTATRVDAPGVLGNDTGVRLSVVGASTPAHGTVSVAPDGSYRYAPDQGFAGVDLFAYVVRDAVGRTSASTVTVTVLPPAVDDREVGLAGHPVTVDPLANDTPGPSIAFLRSSLRLVDPAGGGRVLSVALAHQGTYTVNRDATVTFTPLAGFRGTPTPVRYEVRDTAGEVTGALIRVDYATGIGGATVALGPLVRGAGAALLIGLALLAVSTYRPRKLGRHRRP